MSIGRYVLLFTVMINYLNILCFYLINRAVCVNAHKHICGRGSKYNFYLSRMSVFRLDKTN